MNSFTNFMEKHFLPVANKLNTVKGIISVRDAFIQILPLTLVGSVVTMINVIIFNPTGFIGQYLVSIWPDLGSAQAILSPVLVGTISVMSIFIVFLIARNMAILYDVDGIKAGVTALAAFFILYPPQVDGNFLSSYFGTNGIFTAIITGLLIGYFFSKLSAIDALKIKLPEMVPPEVLKSFMSAIPIAIVLIVTSLIAYAISFVEPNGINVLISTVLQAPIQRLGSSPITSFILITIAMILWIFGINGTNTVSPIYLSVYAAMNLENIAYAAQAGTTVGSPYPYTWFVLFENYGCIGGTGNTLALIVAILILSRKKTWIRDDYTKIAKLSLVPGLFGINEPIIFGLPIVLNPIMAIPFFLCPIVSMALGALLIYTGIVPPGTLDCGWTTPQPLKAFLSTSGSWATTISVILIFVVCVLIYLPFVKMANDATKKELNVEEK